MVFLSKVSYSNIKVRKKQFLLARGDHEQRVAWVMMMKHYTKPNQLAGEIGNIINEVVNYY